MLNFRPLLFILGIFLSTLTAFMLIPGAFALYYGEETVGAFMISSLVAGTAASFCMHQGQSQQLHLNIRDMFLLTSLTWFIVSLFAALPLRSITVLTIPMPSLRPCQGSLPLAQRYFQA